MDPGLVVGPIGQVVNAARQKQQLDGYRDQVLIDALDVVSQQASQAAKAIVDEAEAILTKAEVCRLDNDDDAHAVHVRITEYFQNHPRLTTLQDCLEVLAQLLGPLRDRAGRLLQLPKTKRARKKAVQRFLDGANAMQEFTDSLFFEFRHLPTRTGLAVGPLGRIDDIMIQDREVRLSAAARCWPRWMTVAARSNNRASSERPPGWAPPWSRHGPPFCNGPVHLQPLGRGRPRTALRWTVFSPESEA